MLDRIVKLTISVILYPFMIFLGWVRSLFVKTTRGKFIVLTYHRVNDRQISNFEKQMTLLSKTGEAVFADFSDHSFDQQDHIAVTFDDGFQSTLHNALPILYNKRIPATVFIPAGCLGKPPAWVGKPMHAYPDETVMTADQIRSLPFDLVKIGSHGSSHLRLTDLTPERVKSELIDSMNKLEEITGKKVTLLSFPYNDFDRDIIHSAKDVGYLRVFANMPVRDNSEHAGFLFGRIDASPDDWLVEYWLKSRGGYNWLSYAISAKRKFINSFKSPLVIFA